MVERTWKPSTGFIYWIIYETSLGNSKAKVDLAAMTNWRSIEAINMLTFSQK